MTNKRARRARLRDGAGGAATVRAGSPQRRPATGGQRKQAAKAEPRLHESEVPEGAAEPELPPAPTAEESREQKTAYDASAQRLEELLRAQNPGMGRAAGDHV
jgi:hypothetical protein